MEWKPLAAVIASPPSVVPSPVDSLIAALTIEGLIFTAFTFAIQLAGPRPAGRRIFFAKAWFGWLFVLAIVAAAVSAGASWWAAYRPDTLTGVNAWLRAGGLISGIVAPPIFAAIINWQARSS